MLKLIEGIKQAIEAFVEQRDDFTLVVSCSDNDAPIILKLVEDLDQANATDVFLSFANEFTDPDNYVDAVISALREQHALACEWLGQNERKPLSPLPPELSDASLSPQRRLAIMMGYVRSLLPANGGHRVVCTFFPQAIADRRRYLDLVSGLVPHRLHSGLRGLRLVFRDEPDTSAFAPALAQARRVRLESFDLGPEALQRALHDEVEDEELPIERRMQALLQNALIDGGHGRKSDALRQLWVLLGHYQQTGNAMLQAVVLNAVGDVYRRAADVVRAQEFYECAVPQAVASKSPVIFHTVVRNLADLAYEGKRYSEAEQLYDNARELAGKMLYAEGSALALRQRGLCQAYQRNYADAIGSWESAASICRATAMPDQLRGNLEYLVRAYGHLGESDRAAAVRTELQQLDPQDHAG